MIFHMYPWPLEQTRPMMRWARPWPPGWPPPTPTLVEATMRNALLLLVVVVAALEVKIVLILLILTIILPLFTFPHHHQHFTLHTTIGTHSYSSHSPL